MKRPFSSPLWAIWYDQGGPAGDGGWHRSGTAAPTVYESRGLAELALWDAKWSGKSPRIVELRGSEIPIAEIFVKFDGSFDWTSLKFSNNGAKR